MRVTVHTEDSEVTSDPVVPAPRPILYDHHSRPLVRPIGFRVGLDNRPGDKVNSNHKIK